MQNNSLVMSEKNGTKSLMILWKFSKELKMRGDFHLETHKVSSFVLVSINVENLSSFFEARPPTPNSIGR